MHSSNQAKDPERVGRAGCELWLSQQESEQEASALHDDGPQGS